MPKEGFNGIIFLRCTDEQVALLRDIHHRDGIKPQEFARRLLAAGCQLYAREGRLRVPLLVENQPLMAADGPGPGYNPARDALLAAKASLENRSPTPEPLCPPKSPLSAGDSRGKKSRRKRGGG
jgi:hypothetical protein